MKKQNSLNKLFILLLLCSLSALPLAGQDDERPQSPTLDMVTVDPATGFALLKWLPSPSPDVGSYVVYIYTEERADAIDTIYSPFVFEYTHTASVARYRSVSYVVAAIDSSDNPSPLSNSLSTIWLSAAEDPCTATVTVSWTNYDNQFHPGSGYRLHITDGTGGSYPEVVLPLSSTQYLFTGYEADTEYCFHVTASDGTVPLSSSNRACITTGSEVAPEWVRIYAIAVDNGGISFSAGYDPSTVMNDFRLFRHDPVEAAWDEAASSTGVAGRVSFFMAQADTTVVRLYRVAAMNSCGLASTVSAPSRNMVPEASISGTVVNLRWNRPSAGWSGLFSVWRDTGDGMREVVSSLSDTLWSDDYTTFATDVSAAEVVYRVSTTDLSAPAGTGPHLSSAAVIEASENVFMPNAFTPGSTDENAIFRPEFSFHPGEYDFRVVSRSGVLLFRTGDPGEGWDGRHNGRMMPPGVYLWSLRLTTTSGQTLERNGTVTILP